MTASDSGGGLDIRSELASLDQGVRAVREKLEEEAVKRDERIRLSNEAIAAAHGAAKRASRVALVAIVAGLVGIGIGAVGIGIGAVGTNAAHGARRSLADYKAATQKARVGSCEQYNVHEGTQAQIEKNEERARQAENTAALRRLLVLLQITPADLVALQAEHLRKYDATVDRAHALRDCSPAGIERFLQGVTTTTAGTLP